MLPLLWFCGVLLVVVWWGCHLLKSLNLKSVVESNSCCGIFCGCEGLGDFLEAMESQIVTLDLFKGVM